MTITPSTPIRSIGDAGKSAWQAELGKVNSPILAELDACIAAAHPHGALALVQSARESTYGTTPIARANRNPLGLMVAGSVPSQLQFFIRWADAFAEFARRISNANPPYDPQDISIKEYIRVYVGGPGCRPDTGYTCANFENHTKTDAYMAATIDDLNRLVSTTPAPQPQPNPQPSPGPAMKSWPIAGSSKALLLPADVAFKQALFPASQKNQRPGIAMQPAYYTQHDTANTSAGADAEMHSRWFDQGGPGGDAPDGKIGIHFIVDDKIVIQKCPINEATWHAGDGGGPGNMQSVGTELCVNRDRDAAKAERNAAALAAGVLNVIGQPLYRMRTHLSWVGPSGHHCPASLLPKWPAYQQAVAGWMTGGQPAAPRFPNPANIPDATLAAWFPWANPDGPVTKWIAANRWAHGRMPDLLHQEPGKFYALSDGTILVYANGQVTEVTG